MKKFLPVWIFSLGLGMLMAQLIPSIDFLPVAMVAYFGGGIIGATITWIILKEVRRG